MTTARVAEHIAHIVRGLWSRHNLEESTARVVDIPCPPELIR
jgi:hypothetical protein